jgi:hypothetical protein
MGPAVREYLVHIARKLWAKGARSFPLVEVLEMPTIFCITNGITVV